MSGGFFNFNSGITGSVIPASAFPKLGSRLAFASPAGAIAAAPAGFSANPAAPTGRLEVTLGAGNATWNSLTLGYDGQFLKIINNDPANTLTLPQSGGWSGSGDLMLPPGWSTLVICDLTAAAWQVTSP